MTAISVNTPVPAIDYSAIEERMRDATVGKLERDRPQLQATIDTAKEAQRTAIMDLDEFQRDATRTVIPKLLIGSSAFAVGFAAAVTGRPQHLMNMPTRLGVGALGAATFAGMMFSLVKDLDHSNARAGNIERAAKRDAATKTYYQAQDALIDATRAARPYESIAPGTAWVVPLVGSDRVTLQDATEQVLTMFDHDHDGSIRLDDSSKTARNETIRHPSGGPVTSDRDAVYRLGLERWDTDHDASLSRTELAEGLVQRSVDAPYF